MIDGAHRVRRSSARLAQRIEYTTRILKHIRHGIGLGYWMLVAGQGRLDSGKGRLPAAYSGPMCSAIAFPPLAIIFPMAMSQIGNGTTDPGPPAAGQANFRYGLNMSAWGPRLVAWRGADLPLPRTSRTCYRGLRRNAIIRTSCRSLIPAYLEDIRCAGMMFRWLRFGSSFS